MTGITWMLIVFFALLLLRAPISVSLCTSALVYFLLSGQPIEFVAQRIVAGVDSFPLMAIPLFVLAGTVMARGGIASANLEFADTLVGHWRGGLAQVNVLNSVFMGGMTGSAVADAATDAKVLVPVMIRKGYSNEFSSALSAASGIIAPLIPPGIGLVLYALTVQESVGRLFLGSLIPALLIAVVMSITVNLVARRRGFKSDRSRRARGKEVWRAFIRALPALGMPFLLIVGLRMGMFTPTELAALAAVYSLIVGAFVYRKITFKNLPAVFREAVVASGMVMLLIGGGAAFGNAMIRERVPQRVAGLLTSISDNWMVILIIINVLLLILGMIMDGSMLIIMLAPLLAVATAQLGIDPIHFGVLMVINITIGGITPPAGVVLLSVVGITKAPMGGSFFEMVPFLIGSIGVLFLVSFVPQIILWLPNLIMG